MSERRLMLLDTAALYFRAFHGLPETITAPDGTPVNAVRGLLDIIARLVADNSPTDLVACWDDAWRPRWRVELVPSYKSQRVEREGSGDRADVETVPEALTAQVPLIREVLDALGIPVAGAPDHEADDVIGTLSATATMPVDVVTSDRDLFQVVDDERRVQIVYTARGMKHIELVTDAVVRGRYGVSAAQYADFATLRGDPSDGLPGVAGIGEKTAAGLLQEFGDLDALLRAAAEGRGMSASVAAKLTAATDYLRRAVPVVRVVRDLPLPPRPTALGRVDHDRAARLAERLGLGRSMDRAVQMLQTGSV